MDFDAADREMDAKTIGTAPPTLRARAMSGIIWVGLQSIAARLTGIVGQVILARFLLSAADFGLIGLSLTFSTFGLLFQQSGIREVLVQRQRGFNRWANAAFWMSLALGIFGGAATLACAPAAARIFKQPRLLGLLVVVAATLPVNALAVVPIAKLQKELQFKRLSAVMAGEAVALTLLTILFAYIGWGPYCVVAAQLAVAFLRLPFLWTLERITVSRSLDFHYWRFLFGDSVMVLASGFAIAMVTQGDYIALGIFRSASDVGIYYFAFNLSLQLHTLLSAAFVNVLLAALSRLQSDKTRQKQAFLSVTRLLASVGIPLCFFQAAFARPLIEFVFGAKWQAAVPLLQVFCVGVGFRLATGPAYGMLKAQGRFRAYFMYAFSYCVLFEASVMLGAWLGGPLPVTIIAASFMILFDPIIIYLSIRGGISGLYELAAVYFAPVVAGLAAVAVSAAIARGLLGRFDGPAAGGAKLIVGFACLALGYPALSKLIAPSRWDELVRHLRPHVQGISSRLRRKAISTATPG